MKPPKHFYEVITEGRKHEITKLIVIYYYLGAVCRLYFDIEFNLDMNPDILGITILETFIEVCHKHTKINCPPL